MERKEEAVLKDADGRPTEGTGNIGKGSGKTGGRAGGIAAAVLFGLFLFTAGMFVCIRPICANLVHEAFLGRAVALRVNDVIWEQFRMDDIEQAVRIQEMVEDNGQLEWIAAKYLDALAGASGMEGEFVQPDVTEELAALNEDIIRALEDTSGQKLEEAGRQSMLAKLGEAEDKCLEILDELPYFIGNFGKPARLALGLYNILASWWMFSLMLVVLVLLGFIMYRAQKEDMLRHMAFSFLTDGILLGLLLPWGIGKVSYQVTNRVIGRSWEIDASPLRYVGLLLGGIAVALILAYFVLKVKASQSGEK